MKIDENLLYKKIGNSIKSKRSDLGFSQQILAEKVNLSRTSVTNIEAGEQKVPLHTLYQICLFLDLEIDDVLPSLSEIILTRENVEQTSIDQQSEELSPQTAQFVHEILDDLEGNNE